MSFKGTTEAQSGSSTVKSTYEMDFSATSATCADVANAGAAVSRYMLEAATKVITFADSHLSTATETSLDSGTKRKRDAPLNMSEDSVPVPAKQRIVTPELPLTISSVGHDITVNTPLDATVGELKKLIGIQLDEPPEQQRLACGNKVLNDNQTLLELIRKNFTVHRTKHFTIWVETHDGERFSAKVASSKTIRDVKEAIEGRMGIPRNQQRIYFDAEPLCESRTIDQIDGLDEGSTLEVFKERIGC